MLLLLHIAFLYCVTSAPAGSVADGFLHRGTLSASHYLSKGSDFK